MKDQDWRIRKQWIGGVEERKIAGERWGRRHDDCHCRVARLPRLIAVPVQLRVMSLFVTRRSSSMRAAMCPEKGGEKSIGCRSTTTTRTDPGSNERAGQLAHEGATKTEKVHVLGATQQQQH